MRLLHRTHKRPGGVLFWFLLCLPVLLAILALCLDEGRLFLERRHVQSTADAAALATAKALRDHHDTYSGQVPLSVLEQAARDMAEANGIVHDGTETVVAVNTPPSEGEFAGKDGYVEVTIQTTVEGTFSRTFTQDEMKVTARAVCRGGAQLIGIVLLNPNIDDSFDVSGNGQVEVVGAPIIVNSTSSVAYHSSGDGTISASRHAIVGGFEKSGSATITGQVQTSQPPTSDPLASLPYPNITSHPVRSNSHTSISSSSPVTLDPGVYRDGISISSDALVTLLPGIYIMDGGGFQVSGNGPLVADEVMIFNTGGGNADQITFSGNGNVTWTPPSAGTYKGIGWFQARDVDKTVQVSGNGILSMTGLIYAKNARVQVSGNGNFDGSPLGGGYVVDRMEISGNGIFRVVPQNTNSSLSGEISLVE